MLVKLILLVLQLLLFLILFVLGSVLLPFLPFVPVWQVVTSPGRAFVLNGIVFAAAIYLVILLTEASRKRLRDAGLVTTMAFLLAIGLGLLMRFGFKSL